MRCRVCNTPYMIAPGIGPYCPDLECDSHVGKDERDLEAVDQFEVRRRQRDGRVFANMADAALHRLKALCLVDCKRTEAVWRAIQREMPSLSHTGQETAGCAATRHVTCQTVQEILG